MNLDVIVEVDARALPFRELRNCRPGAELAGIGAAILPDVQRS